MDTNKNKQNANNLVVGFPVGFIKSISKATTTQEVLDIASYWISSMVKADRASVTLTDPVDSEHLKIYSFQGAQAIPLHTTIPIKGTIVGECFSERKVVRCGVMAASDTLDGQMLYEAGLKSCLDAPLVSGDKCYGTLNVAHSAEDFYNDTHGFIMECMAGWLASQIRILDKVRRNQVLANTDFLTGLLNRRSFMDRATGHFQEFKISGKPFALALLDIDYFKVINDTYGHDAGDRVLKEVSELLCSQVRGTDLVARFGGEEFVLLLGSINKSKFDRVVNKCKQSMTAIEVLLREGPLDVGASIGLTYSDVADKSLEVIIKRADKLLYQAKQNGRKQVQFDPYFSIEAKVELEDCEASA